jgi:hypothetical protein
VDQFFGYKLDAPANEPIRLVLLWAPLDLEARRLGRLKGWGRRTLPSGCSAGHSNRTMRRWEHAYNSTCESALQASDSELADTLSELDHRWIGAFGMGECETVIDEVQEFQRRFHVADGYAATYLGHGRSSLRLWVDP